MAERLYALGDIGATHLRVGVYDDQSECLDVYYAQTNPKDYAGTVQTIADRAQGIAGVVADGEIVAASMAVAAEVNESGVLTKSGGLTPWVGRNLGADIEAALGLPQGLVGTPNDVVAIAISQQHINRSNNRAVEGIATTLSSGWNCALYFEEDGKTQSDESGHEHLRPGGVCTCGQEGHAEAFISGGGIKINHGMDMEEWLRSTPGASRELVTDISTAMIAMIERHEAGSWFEAEELRWTGGVALGQPFIMQRVAHEIKERFGTRIATDTVTMGDQAGLHGTFIDAQRRATNY